MTDPLGSAPSSEYLDFLARLRARAGLEDDQAARVARATLSALGRSISVGQATQLAASLPTELGGELAAPAGQAKPFDRAAFLDSVSSGTPGVDGALVEDQVRATLRTVREAAPEGQIDDTVAQLPNELAELFQ